MKFGGAVSSVVLVGIFAAAASGPIAADSPTFDRGQDGAVIVTASRAHDNGIGAGTIVAVTDAAVDVLTAKHVATFGTLTVSLPAGVVVPAYVVRLVPDRDLAVIEASVDVDVAARLHAPPLGVPEPNAPVHVWGSGHDGPAFESGAIPPKLGNLPDGAANGRFTLACQLCHQGDSGAGVFDADGRLVGVFVGFFTLDTGRLPVAESVDDDGELPRATPNFDRSDVLNSPSASMPFADPG